MPIFTESSYYLVGSILYIFWKTDALFNTCISNTLSQSSLAFSFSWVSFEEQMYLILMKSNLLFFSSMYWLFVYYLIKSPHYPPPPQKKKKQVIKALPLEGKKFWSRKSYVSKTIYKSLNMQRLKWGVESIDNHMWKCDGKCVFNGIWD